MEYRVYFDDAVSERKVKLVKVHDRDFASESDDELKHPWLFRGSHSLSDYLVDGVPF